MSNPILHLRASDLEAGDVQIRFVAGQPYYVALAHTPYDERGEWTVSVRARGSNDLLDSYPFNYLMDARRSFKTAVRHLAAYNEPTTPTGVVPVWASFRTQTKHGI